MKNITIREAYDWLYLGEQQSSGLTSMEWEHLIEFLEGTYKNQNVVEHGNRRIRFINLVGVIQLKTVRIEILPKLDLHHEDTVLNRRALLNMLSMTKKLPVQLNDRTLSEFEKVDLSHLLAHLYITELFKALKRGLFRGYFSKSENMNHLRGRILVSQHIRKNAFASVKAFCEYDELTPNVQLNQLLKAALKIIYPFVKHSTLKTQTLMIFEMFDEVDDVYIHPSTMEEIQINRQNQHYEGVLQLALAIIHSTAMSTGVKNQIGFSFLFKMNDLFEGYVGECLKRVLAGTPVKLDLQHREKRLLIDAYTERGTVLLKPDFVVSKLEQNKLVPLIILDTKWKNIQFHSKQSDIYQMYAYITAYKTAAQCIILYPQIGEVAVQPKWRVPDSLPVKHIEVHTIRLDKAKHTMDDISGFLTIL